MKDQRLKIVRSFVSASLLALSVTPVSAATITENFSSDPLQNGWAIFGDTNLFHWNTTNQNLEVTWDSRKTNSYFRHPIGTIVTRNDDFSIEFDLNLTDIQSGIEPLKTGPRQIALGLVKFSVVSDSSFGRGIWGGTPNIAEFNYYTEGYYDYFGTIYPAAAATVPSFISGVDSYAYAPEKVAPFNNILPTNQSVHIAMTFTASNQTTVLAITAGGNPVGNLPALILNEANNFTASDNYYTDTFSISSYSSFGDDFNSVLAHGIIDNLIITVPPPPVQNLIGTFNLASYWECSFTARTNWLYTLERSTNLVDWAAVVTNSLGLDGLKSLGDTNTPTTKAFYRVRADRP